MPSSAKAKSVGAVASGRTASPAAERIRSLIRSQAPSATITATDNAAARTPWPPRIRLNTDIAFSPCRGMARAPFSITADGRADKGRAGLKLWSRSRCGYFAACVARKARSVAAVEQVARQHPDHDQVDHQHGHRQPAGMLDQRIHIEGQVHGRADATQPRSPPAHAPQAPGLDETQRRIVEADRRGEVHGTGIDDVGQPVDRAVVRIELEAVDQLMQPALQRGRAEDFQAAGRHQGEQALGGFEDRDDMQSRMRVRIRVVVRMLMLGDVGHGQATPVAISSMAYAAREARLRSLSVRNFLRRRISFGVTSTSSSSSMKSSACSREYLIAGVSLIASSLPEARMLVSGLGLIALTVRSLSLEWMPISWPSYTWSPSAANRRPRSSSGPSE